MNSFGKIVLVLAGVLIAVGCGKGRLETEITLDDLNRTTKSDNVFVIGHVPSANVLKVARRFKPLFDYLERELGKTIKLKFRPDYSGIIEKMGEGSYDMVIVGAQAYTKALAEGAKYTAILKPRRFGNSFYRSIIIARYDGKVKSLEDIRGKKFAFSDPDSTSGYLFPKVLLLQNGLVPSRDFSVKFAGGHDNVVLNVYRGEYDAGACFDDARKTVFSREPQKVRELVVVANTPDIPNEPYAIRNDILEKEGEFVNKLIGAFLKLDKIPEGEPILKTLGEGINGYDRAADKDYDVVREAEKVLRAAEQG